MRLTAGDDEPSNETGAYYLPQIFQMPSAFDGGHGWAVLLVDITRLRRMDAAKTRALSMLGHEVKTPVAGVRMTLQLLLDEKIDTPGGVFYIDGASVLYLVGSTMDWQEDDFAAGFVFANPNAKGACGCGESFTV